MCIFFHGGKERGRVYCKRNTRKSFLPVARSVIAVQLQIQIEKALALAAVHLVQTLADPGLLIEHCAVQTQELDVGYLSWNKLIESDTDFDFLFATTRENERQCVRARL